MNEYPDDVSNPEEGNNKYLWAAVIFFALLSLPHSRFQAAFRVLVWSAIVFGVYTPYVWQHLFDIRSRALFIMLWVVHIALVYELYPLMPDDGFISIGIAAILELMVFSIPAGWIIVRSRTQRDQVREHSGEE